MWERDRVQSHIEGTISQVFPPKYGGKFPFSQRVFSSGPGSIPGCDKKNCFPFHEENTPSFFDGQKHTVPAKKTKTQHLKENCPCLTACQRQAFGLI